MSDRRYLLYGMQGSGSAAIEAALDLCDLLAAVVSRWSGTRAHVRTARPAFHETLQRIEQHPTVSPVFARHWP